MEWKWSNGEVMEKTSRTYTPVYKNLKEYQNKDNLKDNYQNKDNDKDNLRETSSIRLEQREAIIQRNINPFLSTDNYVSDISIQDEFLRPKDSNIKDTGE